MVPNLITALTGPINELEQRMLDAMPAIERWFRLEWMEHTPPLYSSVDIRNAGFKVAPVDTNLFPGGWNNLTPEMVPLAVQSAMAAIEKICPEARNLLIIPENQTRNPQYLANLLQLQNIFAMAGLNVPTIAEQGLPNYVLNGWIAAIGPAGLPEAELQRLYQGFVQGVATPEATQALVAQGYDIQLTPPAATAAFMREDKQRMEAVVKAANVKMD